MLQLPGTARTEMTGCWSWTQAAKAQAAVTQKLAASICLSGRIHLQLPAWAPSSITCSLDVSTPFAYVFWAKLITVLASPPFCSTTSRPVKRPPHRCACAGNEAPNLGLACWCLSRLCQLELLGGLPQGCCRVCRQHTLMVEKAAACASSAWLRFWSTEYNCMKPFTRAGLQSRAQLQRQPSGPHQMPLCRRGVQHHI